MWPNVSTPGIVFTQPSLAVQAAKDECDIHSILKRIRRTGMMPDNCRTPHYLDVTAAPSDYQSALDVVLRNEQMFSELPAEERDRFGNDVLKWLESVHGSDRAAPAATEPSTPNAAADAANHSPSTPNAAADAAN